MKGLNKILPPAARLQSLSHMNHDSSNSYSLCLTGITENEGLLLQLAEVLDERGYTVIAGVRSNKDAKGSLRVVSGDILVSTHCAASLQHCTLGAYALVKPYLGKRLTHH